MAKRTAGKVPSPPSSLPDSPGPPVAHEPPVSPTTNSGNGGDVDTIPSALPAPIEPPDPEDRFTVETPEVAKSVFYQDAPEYKRAMRKGHNRTTRKADLLPPEFKKYQEKLDLNTLKPWLMIARARSGGIQEDKIADTMGIDREVVAKIVANPVFMGFETTYRETLRSTPGLDRAFEDLVEFAPECTEILKKIARMGNEPEHAAVALGAIKMVFAAIGIDTERKRINKEVRTITMSTELRGRLKSIRGGKG